MSQLIKKPAGQTAAIVEGDPWQIVPADAVDLPAGDIIVPLALWRARRDELKTRNSGVGVLLDSNEHPKEIADDLPFLRLVALNFPKFRDGRAFSSARLLRERHGFGGEIRAVGNVLQDQLYYMSRVGFDAFQLDSAHNPQAALAAFGEFSVTYQGDVHDPRPIYRR